MQILVQKTQVNWNRQRKPPHFCIDSMLVEHIFTVRIIYRPDIAQYSGLLQVEKQSFDRGFLFTLPILTVRAIYRPAVASVRWTLAGRISYITI